MIDIVCRQSFIISRTFLADAWSMGRDLRYPSLREVIRLTLTAIAAIGVLMLLVSAMDLGFSLLLSKHAGLLPRT